MPFTSDDDHPPRRNARSFDLDHSAIKAAAWVWHLHESKPGVTTEGRFLSSQSRRRSSSSSDRKISRFRQEAAELGGGGMKIDVPMWDCGSNLYDTFELVTFGNRLDRSLMEAVPLTPPPPPPPPQASVIPHEHHMSSPSHERGGVLRTLSLPKSTQACRQTSKKKHVQNRAATDANRVSLAKSRELSFSVFYQHQVPKRWPSVEKLMKALKKVVDLHKQVSISVGCKHTINIVEPSQRPMEPSIVGEDRDNKLLAKSKGRVSSSHECTVGDDNSLSSMQRSMKTRRNSIDEELLSGRRTEGSISEGTNYHHIVEEWSKPRISSSQNHHKHLHHHHHHHHHHYLHHTLASESARLSPESLSQICAEKGWYLN